MAMGLDERSDVASQRCTIFENGLQKPDVDFGFWRSLSDQCAALYQDEAKAKAKHVNVNQRTAHVVMLRMISELFNSQATMLQLLLD